MKKNFLQEIQTYLCPLGWEFHCFRYRLPLLSLYKLCALELCQSVGLGRGAPGAAENPLQASTSLLDYMKGIPCLRTLKFIQVVILLHITKLEETHCKVATTVKLRLLRQELQQFL